MALQDNPLLDIHPEYQKIYTDLLNRLGLAQTELGNRLRKDIADSTAFPLAVGAPVAMTNAVTKNDLIGGVLRPYRLFKSVGTTATGASVSNGQSAVITNPFASTNTMVYKITTIKINSTATNTLATTITIKNGSTVVYTQNILSGLLPLAGKILDLLASSVPVDVTLPATLTCTSSAGVFDILVDGILV